MNGDASYIDIVSSVFAKASQPVAKQIIWEHKPPQQRPVQTSGAGGSRLGFAMADLGAVTYIYGSLGFLENRDEVIP